MAQRRINWQKVLTVFCTVMAVMWFAAGAFGEQGPRVSIFGLVFLLVALVNFFALRRNSALDTGYDETPPREAAHD